MTAAERFEALQRETFASATHATASSYPPENRLSGDAIARVLTTRRYAVVASSRPDGRPHATPVSFVLAGTELWLPTVAGARRARNVAANPWLVLVVSEGEGDTHLAVIVEGPASVEPGPPDEAVEVPAWATQWIRLTPQRLLTYAAEPPA